jgi:TRAP-type mannitol/chloroaromatic compound transport system substrate-binding protein
MKGMKVIALLISLGICLGLTAIPVNAADKITWKANANWGPQDIPYKTFLNFCNKVKVLTGGRLQLEPYPGGSIVPVFEQFDALRNNIIQLSLVPPTYWAGKNPAFAFLGDIPAAYSSPWELDAFMNYRGGFDLANELYKPFGLQCIGIQIWGVESMPSKRPLRSIEDFKGLKIRAPQGLIADFFAKLGCSVVVLPGGEVYSALDKGIVDATDWTTLSINHNMGFYQICKYILYPGFHAMPLADVTLRKADWDKLPDDIKGILKSSLREMLWETIEQSAIGDIKAFQEERKNGNIFTTIDQASLVKLKEVAKKVRDDWSGKNPMCKKFNDAQKAWLRELGHIE